jgi:hypothetical protein
MLIVVMAYIRALLSFLLSHESQWKAREWLSSAEVPETGSPVSPASA